MKTKALKAFYIIVISILYSVKALSIVNGDIANEEESKFLVKIESDSGLCSGTILSERTILTAGHCLPNQQTANLEITHKAKTYVAESFFKHPDYNSSPRVDLGIIQLKEKTFKLSTFPKVSEIDDLYPGDSLNILGVGRQHSQRPPDGKAYQANLTIERVFPTRFEASDDFVSLCSGDSGGPAYFIDEHREIHLIGVAFFINMNTAAMDNEQARIFRLMNNNWRIFLQRYPDFNRCLGATSVFTRLYEFKDWVKTKTL